MEDLDRHGWHPSSVAFLDGMGLAEMKSTVGEPAASWGLDEFAEVRREAKKQRLLLACEDREYARDPVPFRLEKGWKDGDGRADLSDQAKGVELKKGRAMLPKAIWPNRFARRSAAEKDDEQRLQLEEAERERLSNDLVSLLRKIGWLVKKDSEELLLSQRWLLRRHSMGRRPSTLRQHVRLGRKLASYVKMSYGVPWFREPSDVMEYVAQRLEEPCGKSVPSSILATLRFLEESAEIPESQRLSMDGALRNFFAEINRHPSWAEGNPRSSAKRLPVSVVVSWEKVVTSDDEKPYVRVYAWFKLVKFWAALRWDDTLGIPPSLVELREDRGMRGKIVRSKTTGEGRRVDTQEFFVSKDCWLLSPTWMVTGWKIFKEMGRAFGNLGRDFLLPRPDKHLRGFRGSMVRYSEALSMSRALLNLSTVCAVHSEHNGRLLLTLPDSSGFWSEHSERVTVISWAAAVGVNPEARKRWGRWKPSTDEEYAKTSLTLVFEGQRLLAEKVRDNMELQDIVEDDEVLRDLAAWLSFRGYGEKEVQEQMIRLMMRRGPRWRRSDGFGPVERTSPLEIDQVGSPTEPVPEEGAGLSDLLVDDAGEMEVSRGTFVLSVVGRSKRRTLHQVGACYRIPGVHYKDFLVVGESRPQLQPGEKLCSSCFGKQQKVFAEAEVAEPRSPSVSSASSSTSLEGTDSEDS